MSKGDKKAKSDAAEIVPLLDGDKFQGYTIKEWTLKQLVLISPILELMIGELERRGVTWEEFFALFDNAAAKAAKKSGNGDAQAQGLTISGGFRIFNGILPYLPNFLAISLGREVQEIEDLGAPETIVLVIKVVSANIQHLSGFFGDLNRELASLGKVKTLSGAGSQSQGSSTS